jgi:glycosyltransferase involved in cell wall biosynthesis
VPEGVGNALAALDVFLLASPSEGFSLALTEAWLCGVPVVATRVGAVPELEGTHGQMVVPVPAGAESAELAAAVRRALSADNRVVIERAKEVAWRHFTAQAMADRWTGFLMMIAAPRKAE